MDDEVETLMIDVRAATQGFAQDCTDMGKVFDKEVIDIFERAGGTLERGLLQAIRRGKLGFDELRQIALSVLDQIAQQAIRTLFHGPDISGFFDKIPRFPVPDFLGLPGRATGGPVAPGRGYVVGERGPELFVPTSAGRIEPAAGGRTRDVRVSINVMSPAGASAPQSLERSSRQVASAVRRALTT